MQLNQHEKAVLTNLASADNTGLSVHSANANVGLVDSGIRALLERLVGFGLATGTTNRWEITTEGLKRAAEITFPAETEQMF